MLPHYLGKFTFRNDNSANQIYKLVTLSLCKPTKYLSFYTIIVLLSRNITAGIHNSLLKYRRPKVSNFVFKLKNHFSGVLMDQIRQNVLKPRINFIQM